MSNPERKRMVDVIRENSDDSDYISSFEDIIDEVHFNASEGFLNEDSYEGNYTPLNISKEDIKKILIGYHDSIKEHFHGDSSPIYLKRFGVFFRDENFRIQFIEERPPVDENYLVQHDQMKKDDEELEQLIKERNSSND